MKHVSRVSFTAVALLLLGAGCSQPSPSLSTLQTNDTSDTVPTTMAEQTLTFPGVLDVARIHNKQVRIKTTKGDIVIKLYDDTAPATVSNFVALTEKGFYNNLTFHRREEGFVIQGGDPNGNGTGGPGYTFTDELNDNHEYIRGTVAMANRGPDTNGSQFFIMLGDVPLPKLYSIFGEVMEGMDVVDQITVGDSMLEVSVEDAQ